MVGADCGRPLARAAPLRGGHHFFVRSSLYVFFSSVLLLCMFSSILPLVLFSFREQRRRLGLCLSDTWQMVVVMSEFVSRGVAAFSTPRLSLCVYPLSPCVFFSFFSRWLKLGRGWNSGNVIERRKKKESFVFFPLKLKSSKSKSLSVYRGEKKTTRRPRKFQRPQRPDKCLFSFVFSFFLSSSVSFLVFPVLSDQVKCLYTTPVSLYTHKHMYARFFSIYLINNRSETSWGTASSSNRRVVNVEQGYMFQPVD